MGGRLGARGKRGLHSSSHFRWSLAWALVQRTFFFCKKRECRRSFGHVNANCHPADRYHHLQNGKPHSLCSVHAEALLSRSLVSASRVSSLLLLSGPCGFSWRQLCSKLPFSYMFGWIVAGFVALVPHREVYYECAPGPFCQRTAGSTLRTRECDTVQQGSFSFFFFLMGPARSLQALLHNSLTTSQGSRAEGWTVNQTPHLSR